MFPVFLADPNAARRATPCQGRTLALHGALLGALLGLCLALPGSAETAEPPGVLDGFVVACQANQAFTPDKRSAAIALVSELRGKDARNPAILTEALRVLYPQFSDALASLGQEQTTAAIDALTPLTTHADRYLAAESTYYLARGLVISERYEEALPRLVELTGPRDPYMLHAAAALLMRGQAEARLLDREQAERSLRLFLEKYPNADETERSDAEQELNLLENVAAGSLDDIRDRMRLTQRRLRQGRDDETTRQEQERIVRLIDELLLRAEEQSEQQGTNSSGAAPPPASQPAAGDDPSSGSAAAAAMEAANEPGGAGAASASPLAPLASSGAWGKLRDRERQARALASIKTRFPDRYRQLVEQYYFNLQRTPPAK